MTIKRSVWIGVLVVAALMAVALIIAKLVQCDQQSIEEVVEVVDEPKPELLFGLPKDSFAIATHVVRNNQFLSDILVSVGLTYPKVDQMVTACKPMFDFRKMNVGHKFTFFFDNDSSRSLKHVVYEINRIQYISVSLGDSVTAVMGQKEIVSIEKSANAKIKSSLWKTIQDNNLNPALAIQLSDIFAWSVDFFGIERGDNFKVLYREDFVDGESVGIAKIHAAVFTHHKKEIYAFNFEQDSIWDYFDEKGQSLRKAFLKAPLKFSRISSRFSNARLHPILKIRRPHHGIDYAAPTGTPVHTIGDGRVIAKGWDSKGGGNYLKITHNSVYSTVYMHLSGFAPGIATGSTVKQGQLIGYVGSTGLSSGPHLDFRVFQNGQPIDPLKVESPPVEPVKPENVARFQSFINPLRASLDALVFE